MGHASLLASTLSDCVELTQMVPILVVSDAGIDVGSWGLGFRVGLGLRVLGNRSLTEVLCKRSFP